MEAGPRRVAFGLRLGSVKTLLVGWVLAEVVALVLAIKTLGLGGTILLAIASSLLGILMLRRLGLDAARQLRATMGGGAPEGDVLDGMLSALGALLLILPGFVSDLAGLALAAPSVRQALAARMGGLVRHTGARARRGSAPDVIDLSPAEWRVVDRSEPR